MFMMRRLDATGAFDDTVSKQIVNGPMNEEVLTLAESLRDRARAALGTRNLVLVGLMGAGKSSIGRLVAHQLGIPFVDTDIEIERVSRMTITELFEAYGEEEFRALETRVIKRLLKGGPRVVSTGGGAFINDRTRRHVKRSGLSVWLKADLDVLWERVNKRDTRPLLKTENPKQTLEKLMNARYPIYAEADLTVLSRDVGKEVMVKEVLAAIVERKEESKTP
ncbi:shikimate kinase [Rhizobium leucaenae]|uniref:Shikimate kinase n=2 Tax=Rhizobium leucaenae TaxID=29450 RepID=A0A7W7EJU8_9HYPH|nr:shikimate kinase [Rhizobium leucaenae]MBB6304395.1 shikimate kinase [Rhizobium leucaenae]